MGQVQAIQAPVVAMTIPGIAPQGQNTIQDRIARVTASQDRIARVTASAKTAFSNMAEWAGVVGAIVGTVIVIKIIATHPIMTIIGGIAAVALYRNRHKIALIASLWATMFKNFMGFKQYAWFHKVHDQVIVGGMPLEGKNHLEHFQKENVKVAVCIAEDKELKTEGWFVHPMKKEAWQTANIAFKQFPAPKHSTLSVAKIDEAVDFIHAHIKQKNDKVYVYDANGSGRAAVLSICYLVKHSNLMPREAIKKITQMRPAAALTTEQRGRVYEYFESITPTPPMSPS